MKAKYYPYTLKFIQPGGTSRGILTHKPTWFLTIEHQGKIGIGECSLLPLLSIDDKPDYQEKLQWVCQHIDKGLEQLYQELQDYPSIQFGLEMAFKSLEAQHPFELFPSDFIAHKQPIHINGLVWMGDKEFMKKQIQQKIKEGFSCIKLKIGAIDFDSEIELIRAIRKEYGPEQVQIRVDANGAFSENEVLDRLYKLSEYHIHSIEQPIRQGNCDLMTRLCRTSPFPIALDEELIGITTRESKRKLIQTILPQYIILKPSLIGGFKGTLEWIELAKECNIGWWITSALESNIGLNAIAQFTYSLNSNMYQGLGTGSLFSNNFNSPLEVSNGELMYRSDIQWNIEKIITQIENT